MARSKSKASTAGRSDATVGYEAQLWKNANSLRGSMDAAEFKHVCLALLFLKGISHAYEEMYAALVAEKTHGAEPEDPDEFQAEGNIWVPPAARWLHLKAQARLEQHRPARQRLDGGHRARQSALQHLPLRRGAPA